MRLACLLMLALYWPESEAVKRVPKPESKPSPPVIIWPMDQAVIVPFPPPQWGGQVLIKRNRI